MDLREDLRVLVFQAVLELAGEITIPDVEIGVPKAKEHGDFSTNISLLLASPLRKRPMEIAQLISEKVPTGGLVERVEVKPPGFINFFISKPAVAAGVRDILEAGDEFGKSYSHSGHRVIVEFVSANPTGPLHIGHARNAAVGDCICRALENVGYKVHREYYFNDAGAQMGRLGESVHARYLSLFIEGIVFPDDGYHGEYIREIAEKLYEEVGKGWERRPSTDFASYAEKIIVEWIDHDLKDLGIHFDRKYSESSLHEDGRADQIIGQLEHTGYAYVKDGALWLRTTKEGDDKDRVIVKQDGSKTYLAPDIAYHDDKYKRGFDMLIDLLGADHHSYAIRLKAAMRALGHDPNKLVCIIYQLVTVKQNGEIMKFGKRLGNAISLREMIDELGPDVVRFFFAMRKADSHMEFDWDLAKEHSDKNPVWYVQYAHARCCAIERRAAEEGIPFNGLESVDVSLLSAQPEQDLMLKLYELPRVVEGAGENLDPQRYTAFLREVAEQWNAYQTAGKQNRDLRIIRPDAPELTQARLALARATRHVLKNALSALGISAPERMDREPAAV